jgi:hypothetical protein
MRTRLSFFDQIKQSYRSVYLTFRVRIWAKNRLKGVLFSEQIRKIEKNYWSHVILNRMRKFRLLVTFVFICLKQEYDKMRRTFFCLLFFFYGTTALSGPRLSLYRDFTIIFRHSTLGMTPLDARCRDLYVTTYNTHKKQQSMSAVEFERAFPARES